jgi:excisionase family DNA binding protein
VYTPLEVATMLRVTRTTIYEHIKSGQLKAIRIGNLYRITKAHLEEYIQQNVVNGTWGVEKMNGLEMLAAIIIIEGFIAAGILFEGYFFEKMFKALQTRVLRSTYSRTWSTGQRA